MKIAALIIVAAHAALGIASPPDSVADRPAGRLDGRLAHAGYGYDLPRGCRFVIRIVVVNGIDIPLRYVVCPSAPPADPRTPIG